MKEVMKELCFHFFSIMYLTLFYLIVSFASLSQFDCWIRFSMGSRPWRGLQAIQEVLEKFNTCILIMFLFKPPLHNLIFHHLRNNHHRHHPPLNHRRHEHLHHYHYHHHNHRYHSFMLHNYLLHYLHHHQIRIIILIFIIALNIIIILYLS